MGLNWAELPGMSLGAGERGRNWRKEWKCSVLGNLPEIVNSRQSGFGKALTSAAWLEYQVQWALPNLLDQQKNVQQT